MTALVFQGNSAYEIPAPIDKWATQMPWPGDQQSATATGPQPQYNIVLNKQNVVLVEPTALGKVQPNPIVFTTLSIDPSVLAPSTEQTQPSSDVPLNPCILLNQKPEALLATIPENLQVFAQSDRTKLYNTLPSKTRQQNAETQTPLLVRHKESAV